MHTFLSIVTPNEAVSKTSRYAIGISIGVVLLTGWFSATSILFPSPLEVLLALPNLWLQGGLGQEIINSFLLNLEAIGWSVGISLPLAYLCRVPVIQPLAASLAKLRFLSPIVFYPVMLEAMSSGHGVKLGLLVLGESFFLTTTMIGVVQAIPEFQYDLARTLRMSEWKSIWYVVIRGTVGQALDAIRDNAAMGWSMVMMVEGALRDEGGVGVMLLNNQKHIEFAEVYAISLAILAVGVTQDYLLGVLRKLVCPYDS